MPSTPEIEIVLRNPQSPDNKISYFIEVYENDLASRWLELLKKNLADKLHLEKNYCWLGWAESPRNAEFLCGEINKSITQINNFNKSGIWQEKGLSDYVISDRYTPDKVIMPGEVGDYKEGLSCNHDAMNMLHLHFERLQGETWNISTYYKLADYETKWAIRQLNVLCHELESWILSNRKKYQAPEWQRPSQITTFLNAPRDNLQEHDYDLFLENGYDRELGGVYLHWAQVGKTQFEVFRDENGQDINEATCSAINSLKFYSGEFDVEWGKDINEHNAIWHKEEQQEFKKWLARNGFDPNDPKLSLGYIKLGQVNFGKSFGTDNFFEIIDIMSKHLDIYQINVDGMSCTYDYVWSDPGYKQMQIDLLKPGYDWSRKNA